jgi:hypothetical protein
MPPSRGIEASGDSIVSCRHQDVSMANSTGSSPSSPITWVCWVATLSDAQPSAEASKWRRPARFPHKTHPHSKERLNQQILKKAQKFPRPVLSGPPPPGAARCR